VNVQQVQVIENVLKMNDEIAAMNRRALREAGIAAVNIIGAPGCGKTLLLEETLKRLAGVLRCGVIVGDLATQRDADRMAPYCRQVIQINTGKGCHLEANHVHQALARMDLRDMDVLFIENVGNLICPVGFDLGQDAKVGIFSVSGGDDKAGKHPFIIREADLLLVTKTDLLPYIPFDWNLFREDVQRLNPQAQIMRVSAKSGEGMDAWIEWVVQRRQTGAARRP